MCRRQRFSPFPPVKPDGTPDIPAARGHGGRPGSLYPAETASKARRSADISFQKEDYSAAAAFYLAAADCGEDAYTAPLCFFNAAVSYEQACNNKDAVKYYEKASEYKDFLRRTHAIFSAGRVSESLQDFEGAKKFYSTLEEKYPSDSWTDIAKTRLISLKIAGKIE